jgi:dienelactone hydrolase
MTIKTLLLSGLALGATALAAPSTAHACGSFSGYDVKVITYWQAGAGFDHADERCDNPGNCMLNGWLIAPKTGTNLPAVVFAHGSSGGDSPDKQSVQEYCNIEHRLLDAGYVVFLPFRRGVVDDTTPDVSGVPLASYDAQDNSQIGHPRGYFANTGWAAQDWANLMSSGHPETNTSWYIAYLEEESGDMQAAMSKLVGLTRNGAKLVDHNRVAFAGHSIGGAFATIVSNVVFDPGTQPVAFASLSGAAMSWYGSSWWPTEQNAEAADHRKIIFFQRVLDESDPAFGPVDFQSAVQPFNAAAGHNGGAVLARYDALHLTNSYCHSNYPTLTDQQHYWCTHAAFVQDPTYVDIWWPSFLQFLTNHVM